MSLGLAIIVVIVIIAIAVAVDTWHNGREGYLIYPYLDLKEPGERGNYYAMSETFASVPLPKYSGPAAVKWDKDRRCVAYCEKKPCTIWCR